MRPDHVCEGAPLSHGYCYDPGPVRYLVAVVDLAPAILDGVSWRLVSNERSPDGLHLSSSHARDLMPTLMGSGLYAAVACVAILWDRETDESSIWLAPPLLAVVIDLGAFGPLTPDGHTPTFPGRRSLAEAVSSLWPAREGEKASV